MAPGWLIARRERFEAQLAARFSFGDAWPDSFPAALRYPLATGGKRFRPLICFAAFEAIGGDADTGWERVFPAAVALELVHTYSLVHDDLPAMDDDDERRGQPTVHVKFGEAPAILVGDALLTEAFDVLARAEALPATARVAMVATLARASGARGMVGGQAADIAFSGADLAALERLHALKTGALIAAAATLGALAGDADPAQHAAIAASGRAVGLAFQLADDWLDADEDQGDDGPPSFVKLLGVAETRRRALALIDDAIAAVQPLPRPGALVALARLCVERAV